MIKMKINEMLAEKVAPEISSYRAVPLPIAIFFIFRSVYISVIKLQSRLEINAKDFISSRYCSLLRLTMKFNVLLIAVRSVETLLSIIFEIDSNHSFPSQKYFIIQQLICDLISEFTFKEALIFYIITMMIYSNFSDKFPLIVIT